MLAVIPGVSRSGGTITVGLFLGYNRAAAARYSFLLAIPAVVASGLLEFATTYKSLDSEDLAEYVTSLEKTRDEIDGATGETIAAEVEQFLRDADEER